MKMNKKGFTLIELLAVIVILAVIALIATPVISGIINDSKQSALESEAKTVVSAIDNYCLSRSTLGSTCNLSVSGGNIIDLSASSANVVELQGATATVTVNSTTNKVTDFTITRTSVGTVTYSANATKKYTFAK